MTSIGEQIIQRFVATLNERDFDGFEALFVEDYQQHQTLATNSGSPAAKHGVRAYQQDRLTAFPDMVITAQPYLVTEERNRAGDHASARAGRWCGRPKRAGRDRVRSWMWWPN